MSPNDRNIAILKKMVQYCDEISHAKKRFGESLEKLKSDTEYKNAVAMDILQIGELTTHLTSEFRSEYSEQPWQDINGMRNIAAHHYGSFDVDILWNTINTRVPELREYCIKVLAELQVKRRHD
jgi:uncharacterized protein with HEPN domain